MLRAASTLAWAATRPVVLLGNLISYLSARSTVLRIIFRGIGLVIASPFLIFYLLLAKPVNNLLALFLKNYSGGTTALIGLAVWTVLAPMIGYTAIQFALWPALTYLQAAVGINLTIFLAASRAKLLLTGMFSALAVPFSALDLTRRVRTETRHDAVNRFSSRGEELKTKLGNALEPKRTIEARFSAIKEVLDLAYEGYSYYLRYNRPPDFLVQRYIFDRNSGWAEDIHFGSNRFSPEDRWVEIYSPVHDIAVNERPRNYGETTEHLLQLNGRKAPKALCAQIAAAYPQACCNITGELMHNPGYLETSTGKINVEINSMDQFQRMTGCSLLGLQTEDCRITADQIIQDLAMRETIKEAVAVWPRRIDFNEYIGSARRELAAGRAVHHFNTSIPYVSPLAFLSRAGPAVFVGVGASPEVGRRSSFSNQPRG